MFIIIQRDYCSMMLGIAPNILVDMLKYVCVEFEIHMKNHSTIKEFSGYWTIKGLINKSFKQYILQATWCVSAEDHVVLILIHTNNKKPNA